MNLCMCTEPLLSPFSLYSSHTGLLAVQRSCLRTFALATPRPETFFSQMSSPVPTSSGYYLPLVSRVAMETLGPLPLLSCLVFRDRVSCSTGGLKLTM